VNEHSVLIFLKFSETAMTMLKTVLQM